jgi:hypothetical protein
MILLAVVAASPGTTRREETYSVKKPNGRRSRYRNPAILAVLFIDAFAVWFVILSSS